MSIAMNQSLVIGGDVEYVTTAPTGPCTACPPIKIVASTGVAYTCDNGMWQPVVGTSPYNLPIATTGTLGGIKPDGTTITVDGTTGVASATGGGPAITCDASQVALYGSGVCHATLSREQLLAFDGTIDTRIEAIARSGSGKGIMLTAGSSGVRVRDCAVCVRIYSSLLQSYGAQTFAIPLALAVPFSASENRTSDYFTGSIYW